MSICVHCALVLLLFCLVIWLYLNSPVFDLFYCLFSKEKEKECEFKWRECIAELRGVQKEETIVRIYI